MKAKGKDCYQGDGILKKKKEREKVTMTLTRENNIPEAFCMYQLVSKNRPLENSAQLVCKVLCLWELMFVESGS